MLSILQECLLFHFAGPGRARSNQIRECIPDIPTDWHDDRAAFMLVSGQSTVVSRAGTYVRVQLVRAARVVKIKKTHGQRGTCSPVFNESFAFTVPQGLPDDCR